MTAHLVKTIWMHPRSTIRNIVANDSEYGVFPLTLLAGALVASVEVMGRQGDGNLPVALILALALLAGPVQAFVSLYLGGWLLSLSGRWFGGSATTAELRAAIAWSNAPVVAGGVAWWVFVALEPLIGTGDAFTLLANAVWLLLFAWGYAMLVFLLAAVQHFSLWKSAMILAGLWAGLVGFVLAIAAIGVSGFTSMLDSSFLGMSGAP
jgi:hypothetical protein